MELKPPTSFESQVKRLKDQNILVCDEKQCESFFQRVNYYRFSAYLLPFRGKNKVYKDNTTFETAAKIYEFDSKLRHLVFQAIEEIELQLRTQLAYRHSHQHGPDGYMNAKTFNPKHRHLDFIKLIETEIQKNKNTPVVKHHLGTYDGKLPLWAVIEYFSIGMVSHFYADLILSEKKKFARELYGITPKCLDSWLRCLTDLRNRCAHYARLYYWKFSALPAMPPDFIYTVNQRIFDQLLVLKFLFPRKEHWGIAFVLPLESLIEQYEDYINLNHIGFPKEWVNLLSNESI